MLFKKSEVDSDTQRIRMEEKWGGEKCVYICGHDGSLQLCLCVYGYFFHEDRRLQVKLQQGCHSGWRD